MATWSGRCACGAVLSLAYNRAEDVVFWNCFRCFPHFQTVPVGFTSDLGADR